MALLTLAQTGVFLISLYVGGCVFSLLYAQIIGEIITGLVLGKDVLNWLPFDEAITLLGEIGLVFIVMEGGLSVNFNLLREIGGMAFVIAATGAALPILLGWAVMSGLGHGGLEGVAAGVALSSTSIGMTTKLLQQQNQLHTRLGNLVTVAAMLDDIFSLVILAVIQQLAKKDDSDSSGRRAWLIARPIVVSICIFIIGWILVKAIPPIFAKIKFRDSGTEHIIVIAALLLVTFGMTMASGYAGSTHLLGAFASGMSFAGVPRAAEFWCEHHPATNWLARIFFATIGFTIPVKSLFDPVTFGYGLIQTLPAIAGKFITGFFTRNWLDAQVVGWAMVGRGELGFLMARQSLDDELLTEDSMAITVWALLISTFISPFLVRFSINFRDKRTKGPRKPDPESLVAEKQEHKAPSSEAGGASPQGANGAAPTLPALPLQTSLV